MLKFCSGSLRPIRGNSQLWRLSQTRTSSPMTWERSNIIIHPAGIPFYSFYSLNPSRAGLSYPKGHAQEQQRSSSPATAAFRSCARVPLRFSPKNLILYCRYFNLFGKARPRSSTTWGVTYATVTQAEIRICSIYGLNVFLTHLPYTQSPEQN